MSTFQEIVDRATDIAAGSIDGPLQDAGMMAQSLLPDALQDTARKSALDPYLRTLFRRTLSISVVNGTGNFPDEALTAYACTATVVDQDGNNASYSHYNTFLGAPDPRLAHWAIKQGTELTYLPVGGGTYNGDLEVTIPCVPIIPADPDDPIVMPDEVVNDVIDVLATRMVASYKAVA